MTERKQLSGIPDSPRGAEDEAAGNGLLHRRALLGKSIAAAGVLGTGLGVHATGAAAEPLTEPAWGLQAGEDNTPPYQTPSKFTKNIARTLSNPKFEPRGSLARTPHHMLEGTTTPNGLHFTINHTGVPDIDPQAHRFVIHGMVKRPQVFTLDALLRYPLTSAPAFVECGGNSVPLFSPKPIQDTVQALHGLSSCAEWTGVKLSILLDECGVDPHAKWFIAEGADGPHLMRSIPAAKAWDDAMIAFYQNGEPLMPGNGFPMRLVLPGYEGNMNVKFLRRIKFVPSPAMSFWESQTYTEPMPNGKSYNFDFLNEVKSFITRPSHGHELKQPGIYEISGIAYSGRGKIAKVMVSADGGKSWAEAALQAPVQTKAFTRFRLPWRWNGGPAILQSRAWDDHGAFQPTRKELVAARGQLDSEPPVTAFRNHHCNVITSWGVSSNGKVTHVYA
ncbi:MAG TPA: sulfite dehydrogenase [Rhizomicrobium sp.]|nr:sulfite dehydrogenase [Rhizomicrobium sp.]